MKRHFKPTDDSPVDLMRAFLREDLTRAQSSVSPALRVASSLPADLSNNGLGSHDPGDCSVASMEDSIVAVRSCTSEAPAHNMGGTYVKDLNGELAKEEDEERDSRASVDVGHGDFVERAHTNDEGRVAPLWKVPLWMSAVYRWTLKRIVSAEGSAEDEG